MAAQSHKRCITINGKKNLTVEGGQSLLSTLANEDVFLPTACGGRGICGLCRLRVIDGGGPLLPAEKQRLTPEEIAENVRLSCQIKVLSDIAIEIPEALLAIQRFTGTCEALRDLTYDTKLVRIALDKSDRIDFTAGQYIQLEAPPYGNNPEPVYRAYSMASPPSTTDAIELVIRLVPHGICTTWVHTILKEGDRVSLNGPYGDFRLRDTDRDIIFIAGGSGLAPIRSILKNMAENKSSRTATLYFGAITLKDVYFTEELDALKHTLPGLEYVIALSAPEDADNWEGERGLITEVLERHEPDPSQKEVYACGSPGMIDACVKVLTAKGVSEERIYYDTFA